MKTLIVMFCCLSTTMFAAIGIGPQVVSRGKAPGSIVGQGMRNFAYGTNSTVVGGSNNVSYGLESFIGGGKNLLIQSNKHSTIAGGHDIQIRGNSDANDGHCFVGGGENIWMTNAAWGVIPGGRSNTIVGMSFYATIGGGWENFITNYLATKPASNSIIGGGWKNGIGTWGSTIAGGYQNLIVQTADGGQNSSGNAILGGSRNIITNINGAGYNIIVGGTDNVLTNADNGGSVIVGGNGNQMGAGYAFLGVGIENTVNENAGGSVLVGGESSLVGGAFAFLGVGYFCTNKGLVSGILCGDQNWIDSTSDYSEILGGGSNKVTQSGGGVWGANLTNTTARAKEIGFRDGTKTRITPEGLTTLGASANAAAAVTLTADNQVLNTTTNSYVRLQSDNATAANRTFVLTQGTFTGQWLTIEWVGTLAGELVDDSAQNGAGNHRLSATWTPTQYDTLSLLFNGTDWIERGRSAN